MGLLFKSTFFFFTFLAFLVPSHYTENKENNPFILLALNCFNTVSSHWP